MIHAHCSGALDLTGDSLEPAWWIRVMLSTDYVSRQLRSRLHEYMYDFNMALLDYYTTDDTMSQHIKQATMVRNNISHALLPWVDVGPKTSAEALKAMREKYLATFPDPSSEKGKAAIAKQIAIWKERKRAKSGVPVSER